MTCTLVHNIYSSGKAQQKFLKLNYKRKSRKTQTWRDFECVLKKLLNLWLCCFTGLNSCFSSPITLPVVECASVALTLFRFQ